MNNPILILCGGRSSRMGSPKPLLRYHGQTLIARQVANALPNRAVWLASDGTRFADTDGADYLPDWLPEKQGALSAVLPALQLAENIGYSGVYVMSCDTLLQPEQIIALLNHSPDQMILKQGITALKSDAQLLPLLAHWPVAVAGSLKTWLESGNKRVQYFVQSQPHQTVDLPKNLAELCHFNTPDEFERAKLAAQSFQAA
ncbi:molybdenum cofactor guanylyltransferase [Neisseria leonii]|nr:molybdenum cofactor guanylyltransferase [Neisseria sp. 51.81]MDD9327259.1 molybdenum cofactor guanylyltransferase [Neisseria sp. 51.81]